MPDEGDVMLTDAEEPKLPTLPPTPPTPRRMETVDADDEVAWEERGKALEEVRERGKSPCER